MKPAEVTTPSDREVLVTRSFDAPVALVWRAYTEPDLIRRWMTGYPGWIMNVCEIDVRAGGKYRWRWRHEEDGKEFGFFGQFIEVIPHTRTVHIEHFDPGNMNETMGDEGMEVTTGFAESNGVTTVTTRMKFASQADRDAAMATGMTDGMEVSYQLLDGVLAAK